MNEFTTFANREVCDLIFVDYATKKPVLNRDWANTTASEVTGEAVYAYGGWGHPKRVTFYGEKGGTLTVETQMQSFQLYSIITGAAIENSASFLQREELSVASGALTLSAEPVAGSVSVFAIEDDCGTEAEVTIEGKNVTIADAADGDKYVVYYMTNITEGVKKISIKSTTFPKACTIYGSTYDRTENDEIIPQKMIAYKATPQLTMNMAWSNTGDPASLSIVFDLLADENDNMLDLIALDGE